MLITVLLISGLQRVSSAEKKPRKSWISIPKHSLIELLVLLQSYRKYNTTRAKHFWLHCIVIRTYFSNGIQLDLAVMILHYLFFLYSQPPFKEKMVYKRLLFILILLFIQDKENFLFIQNKENISLFSLSRIKRNFSLFLDPQLQIYWDFYIFYRFFEFTLTIVNFSYLYSKWLCLHGPRPTTGVLPFNPTRRTVAPWTQYCKMFQNKEKISLSE